MSTARPAGGGRLGRRPGAFAWLLAAVTVCLSAVTLEAKEFTFDYQRVVETGPEAELSMTFVSGNLEITTTTDDKIIIDAVKRVHAVGMDEAQLVADHIEIKVEHTGNRVAVMASYLQMRNRSQTFWQKVLGIGGADSYGDVDWAIQVPRDCRIDVSSTSGDVIISHLIGDISIRSSSANVSLMSVEGAVSVESSSGTTMGELLFGPVTVRQAQGKIDLRYVEGDIKVKTTTADVHLIQDRGALDLATSTGNAEIRTSLDSAKDFFVETESGNITLTIPETSSGKLRIQSQTGDIRTDIPISIESMSRRQVKGSFGAGGVMVNLTSISGDVTVAQF